MNRPSLNQRNTIRVCEATEAQTVLNMSLTGTENLTSQRPHRILPINMRMLYMAPRQTIGPENILLIGIENPMDACKVSLLFPVVLWERLTHKEERLEYTLYGLGIISMIYIRARCPSLNIYRPRYCSRRHDNVRRSLGVRNRGYRGWNALRFVACR
jgi:hypothetical protein